MNKKGKLMLIVVIVLLVVAVVGAGSYIILIRDTNAIPGYTYEVPKFNINEICDFYNENEGEICLKASDSIVYYSEEETNDIIQFITTKGTNEHKIKIKSSCDSPNKCNHIRNVYISYPSKTDRPTFVWYYSENEFIRIKQWGERNADVNSEVVKRFLDKYPPIEI